MSMAKAGVQAQARERRLMHQLLDDCRQLLGERGEANSVAVAERVIRGWRALTPPLVGDFFEILAEKFDPDPERVLALAQQYGRSGSPQSLVRLLEAVEPPRQELLRRINRAPDGTATIVAMRARLLRLLREEPRLAAVDADFAHLLSSWFNPGFLRLEQVDWNSPARLLDKIIEHEAVHQIDGWDDLRRRLQPDRRCFAFFHPALPGEPLIFVEVALLDEMPCAIAPLLDRATAPDSTGETADKAAGGRAPPGDRYTVAAFYSISNCQPGLRGVNLGNFLIKRVAVELHRQFPSLRTFCTLSPVPSLSDWMARMMELHAAQLGNPAPGAAADASVPPGKPRREGLPDLLAKARAARDAGSTVDPETARRLCAFHLLNTSPGDGSGADPVARFHLNNGARLERVNASADLSRKGLRESHGVMVNYLYDLHEIENNHERFVAGEVVASSVVRSLA